LRQNKRTKTRPHSSRVLFGERGFHRNVNTNRIMHDCRHPCTCVSVFACWFTCVVNIALYAKSRTYATCTTAVHYNDTKHDLLGAFKLRNTRRFESRWKRRRSNCRFYNSRIEQNAFVTYYHYKSRRAPFNRWKRCRTIACTL